MRLINGKSTENTSASAMIYEKNNKANEKISIFLILCFIKKSSSCKKIMKIKSSGNMYNGKKKIVKVKGYVGNKGVINKWYNDMIVLTMETSAFNFAVNKLRKNAILLINIRALNENTITPTALCWKFFIFSLIMSSHPFQLYSKLFRWRGS